MFCVHVTHARMGIELFTIHAHFQLCWCRLGRATGQHWEEAQSEVIATIHADWLRWVKEPALESDANCGFSTAQLMRAYPCPTYSLGGYCSMANNDSNLRAAD